VGATLRGSCRDRGPPFLNRHLPLVWSASDVSFSSPTWLAIGLFVPIALGIGYLLLQRERRRSVHAFTAPGMKPNVAPVTPGWRRHVPAVLLLCGIALLGLAIAGPRAALSVPRERATVVLTLDASRSMESTDVAPSRLVAARDAALGFIRDLPVRFQIGVVSFARRAQALSRPTSDRVAVRRALQAVETARGTSIGEGLAQALDLRPPPARVRDVPMIVVLLSDGNNTGGRVTPEEAAARARQEGVRVFTIAFGREPGSRRVGDPRPPNLVALRELAGTTRGRFYAAPTGEALDAVLRNLGSQVARVREQREITTAFVGAALVLLLAGGGLSALWFNRLP
jgi:Ca-activated chloride channel family protein